jgi:hypothetical protein
VRDREGHTSRSNLEPSFRVVYSQEIILKRSSSK